MVAHVAHNFAGKIKFRNQKEATISYGNEDVIKLRNFQSENLMTKIREASKSLRWATRSFKILTLGYQWATVKGSPSVAHT